ncbi:MAG: hypothetical protein ACHQUB_00160 [Candidatus Saccharimonadia bacterium]
MSEEQASLSSEEPSFSQSQAYQELGHKQEPPLAEVIEITTGKPIEASDVKSPEVTEWTLESINAQIKSTEDRIHFSQLTIKTMHALQASLNQSLYPIRDELLRKAKKNSKP